MIAKGWMTLAVVASLSFGPALLAGEDGKSREMNSQTTAAGAQNTGTDSQESGQEGEDKDSDERQPNSNTGVNEN